MWVDGSGSCLNNSKVEVPVVALCSIPKLALLSSRENNAHFLMGLIHVAVAQTDLLTKPKQCALRWCGCTTKEPCLYQVCEPENYFSELE